MSKPTAKIPKGLMDVRVQIDENVFELSLSEVLKIDSDFQGLNDTLVQLPLDYGMWLKMEMDVIRRVSKLETALEEHEAELYVSIPDLIESKLGKKPTVDAIKAHILLDDERKKIAEELAEARHDKATIAAGCRSLQVKKDCALELARNMRSEMAMTGGPTVKAGEKMDEVFGPRR